MTSHVQVLAPAAAEDDAVVEALVRVINAAYAVGEEGLWLDGWVRVTRGEVQEAVRSEGMFAASVDGEIVGAAFVRPIDATTSDLGLVSATPAHWGTGLGGEIVRAAEDRVRGQGVTAMQLELLVPQEWVHPHKDRLRRWYIRLGYEVVRTAAFEEVATHAASQLATPCEFLVFKKSLAAGAGA
jgi:GNAT superfamily N-acetyltransferase